MRALPLFPLWPLIPSCYVTFLPQIIGTQILGTVSSGLLGQWGRHVSLRPPALVCCLSYLTLPLWLPPVSVISLLATLPVSPQPPNTLTLLCPDPQKTHSHLDHLDAVLSAWTLFPQISPWLVLSFQLSCHRIHIHFSKM